MLKANDDKTKAAVTAVCAGEMPREQHMTHLGRAMLLWMRIVELSSQLT